MESATMPNRSTQSFGSWPLPHTPVRSTSSSQSNWSSLSLSSNKTDSTPLWQTPQKRWRVAIFKSWRIPVPNTANTRQQWAYNSWKYALQNTDVFNLRILSRRLVVLITCVTFVFVLIFLRPEHHNPGLPDVHALTAYQPIRPALPPTDKLLPDPIQWLEKNSNNRYAVLNSALPHVPRLGGSSRPRAALISLVRNSELEGMMQSMRQLEFRWNRKYQVIFRLSKCHAGSDII
jgi:hypothetical protein